LDKPCNTPGTAGDGWPPTSVWPGYFCTQTLATGCSFDLRGQSRCGITTYSSLPPQDQYLSDHTMGGLSSLADYCPLYSTTKSCVDNTNTGSSDEYYGVNSRCFVDSLTDATSIGGSSSVGSMVNSAFNQVTQQMGCYESYCAFETNTTTLVMKVVVDNLAYLCPADKSISVSGKAGSIVCPPATQIVAVCANEPIDTSYPIIDSISPAAGKPNDTIQVYGTGFQMLANVSVDADCQTVTWVSSNQLTCVLASQDSYKDPLYIGALSSISTKKTVTVTNPDKRGTALVDAFELSVDFNLSAIDNFFALMARNPINTAIVCVAIFLGCLCCIYCMCAGRRSGGNNARSRRKDYRASGHYF